MPSTRSRPPVTVALLALPESTPTALYGLLELFAAVGVAWEAVTGERRPSRRFDAQIVARRRRPFTGELGVRIAPTGALPNVAPDLVIVTDLALTGGLDPPRRWAAEARWVATVHRQGSTVCSVCTGALLLAEAGLLDGREATTHWSAVDLLRHRYPDVKLRPERILCASEVDHRVITSGGASSWEDLALYLVARYAGRAEAARIAKLFLLGDRSEGQLPFAVLSRGRRHGDAPILKAQQWVAKNYQRRHPVRDMVRHSGLAARTFKRRFHAATGYSPMEYVQTLRVEEAKHLLETTARSAESIAELVGYGDPAAFRRLFARLSGTTPARYRQRFGCTGPTRASE
jgi:transcriptional regulator GlxA family with amidase domain